MGTDCASFTVFRGNLVFHSWLTTENKEEIILLSDGYTLRQALAHAENLILSALQQTQISNLQFESEIKALGATAQISEMSEEFGRTLIETDFEYPNEFRTKEQSLRLGANLG